MKPDRNENIQPVIIIGGGPVGLISSILLSLQGIANILFERHPSTSIHPKATGINQRTTEIFRVIGIEDEVYAHATPAGVAGRTAWYTSLGEEGREVFSRDAWGGGRYEAEYATHSPSKYCILPQIRLEPILKKRAMELNAEGIRYNKHSRGRGLSRSQRERTAVGSNISASCTVCGRCGWRPDVHRTTWSEVEW